MILTTLLLAPSLHACVAPPADDGRGDVANELADRLGEPVARSVEQERTGQRASEAIQAILADGRLEADEAVRLAVANNAGLRAALAELDVARAELWSASLLPNPVLDAELQFVESGGGDLLELAVAQDVVGALLVPRRRQIAVERFEEVKAEVTGAVVDLATEVRIAYRSLQAERELVELYRTATDATYYAYDAARRLREAGNVPELDLLQERALYEDAKMALVDARRRASLLRENLNALLGLWGPVGESWSVSPRLPLPEPLEVDGAHLEANVLARSLDLRGMRHRLTALGHAAGVERIEALLPEGAAGVVAEREGDETWTVGPMISVAIPVFDFGRAASAEVRARFERAYARFTEFAVRLRRHARSTYLESASTREAVRYQLEVVLPLRARVMQHTQRQFNAMQIGVFQLLEARRGELDAGRRYVETLRDHWIARTELEALLVGRLPRGGFGLDTAVAGGGSSMATAGSGGH